MATHEGPLGKGDAEQVLAYRELDARLRYTLPSGGTDWVPGRYGANPGDYIFRRQGDDPGLPPFLVRNADFAAEFRLTQAEKDRLWDAEAAAQAEAQAKRETAAALVDDGHTDNAATVQDAVDDLAERQARATGGGWYVDVADPEVKMQGRAAVEAAGYVIVE